MIFVVHASLDARGQIRGLVTHAQTGRKEQFSDAAHLGHVIAAMTASQGDGGQPALDQLEEDSK